MSQAQLIEWASNHPGRLAGRGLQSMADAVGRDGEVGMWTKYDTPASAKSYYQRVIKPQLQTCRPQYSPKSGDVSCCLRL